MKNDALIFESINFRDTWIFASGGFWKFRKHLISRIFQFAKFAKINDREN